MNISGDVYKVISDNKYIKSNKDFQGAMERFEHMEERNILKKRGYTLKTINDQNQEFKYNIIIET